MATSPKGIESLKEDHNSNLRKSSAHLQEVAVATEDDLDGILRDVEEIEASTARCGKDKPTWKPRLEFTEADETALNKIFEDAEKRKKNIEELLEAKNCDSNSSDDNDDDDDGDDETSSNSSSSSEDSIDSDLDRFLDEVGTENGLHMAEKRHENEMDRILEEVERSESKADFKK